MNAIENRVAADAWESPCCDDCIHLDEAISIEKLP